MMKLLFENYQSLTLLPVSCYPFNFWWIQPVCLSILPEGDVIKMCRWWRLWYVHFFYLPVFIPSPGEFFSCGPFAKWNLFGYAKVEVHFWKDLSNCSDSLLLPLVCMHIYLGSNWQCSLLYIRQVMGLFFSDPKSGLC